MQTPWTFKETIKSWQWLDLIISYHDEICPIVPEKDQDGYLSEYMNQLKYLNKQGDWN